MQTKEQIKNWKVVASVATVAALGVSGLAVANAGEPADTPAPIEIQDQRTTGETFATTTTLGFEVVPAPSFSHGSDSLDSPLASASLDSPSPDSPSLESPSLESPSPDSSATAPAPSQADDSPSPDSPSPDSPSADSPDSVDSGDSLDS